MGKMIRLYKESGNCYFKLESFKDFLDITKVAYYELKIVDGVLSLKFFDSDKKVLKTTDSKKSLT